MSRRPRVALVCGTYARARDGVADYTGMLAAALPPAGVDAAVVSAAGADPGALAVTRAWDVRGTLAAARALRRLAPAPDVVHVQFAPSAYGFSAAVGLLPALVGVPVVATLHEYGWWSWPARVRPAAWRPAERAGAWDRETALLGPRAAALVATNPGHAAAVRARLRRDPLVVPIGPNVVPADAGADRGGVRAGVRAALGLPAGAPLLVFFGFVHPVKGVRYALDALAELRRDDPRTHLAVAGGFASLALPGEEAAAFRRELEGHAADRGVAGAVTFTGHRPAAEVSRLLTAADAVVLPLTAGVTTKSGALLAAWAHAAPVVATVADDPDPALADGATAVLVGARRDGPALAHGVRRLLGDPALSARVAAGGAALAAGRSWERAAAAHAGLYREVLGR